MGEEEGDGMLISFSAYGEHVFTFLFVFELFLRYLNSGWTWFFNKGNFWDSVLVLGFGALVTWVLVPFGGLPELLILRKFTVLRAIRLFHSVNESVHKEELKELAMLLHGLKHGVSMLFWVGVMITFLLYLFALFATELVAKHEDFKHEEEVQDQFGEVSLSMFSLFQILTLDRWTGIVRPLMRRQSWTVYFFIFFISLASFVMMNLVTAVMVEQAFGFMRQSEDEMVHAREKAKQMELDSLRSIFEDLDEDGNGRLTKEELDASRRHPKIQKQLRKLDITAKEIEELWDILDDGDGELTVHEFVNGMKKMKGAARARDTMHVMRELKEVDAHISVLNDRIDVVSVDVDVVKDEVGLVHKDMGLLLRVCKKLDELDAGPDDLPARAVSFGRRNAPSAARPKQLPPLEDLARRAPDAPPISGRSTDGHGGNSAKAGNGGASDGGRPPRPLTLPGSVPRVR